MSGFGRKIARKQALRLAKEHDTKALAKQVETLPQALSLIKDLHKNLEDAQKAVVQVLGELDVLDFEQRRQRAVSLRMQIDAGNGRAPVAWIEGDGERIKASDEEFMQAMLEYEDQLRGEYDAVFALVSAFVSKDEPKQPEET
jgi:hypothetical protein